VNYYKRHIGDYAAKAGHLTPLEHGVYGLLIDAYYNREEAPTKAEAIRWARARSKDELAALDAVLAEFFIEVDGRFTQSRVEEELSQFRNRQETNRELGAKGGAAKSKRIAKPIASESLSEDVAKDDELRLANVKPSHKPLANSQEEAKACARQAARFGEFWDAYPVKKGRKAAEWKWRQQNLDAIADQILDDVRARMTKDRQWLNGFIPHGSTYINAAGWEDAIEAPRAPAGTEVPRRLKELA
jgi:uncharacterized protein YdaU (DUF1376 family)